MIEIYSDYVKIDGKNVSLIIKKHKERAFLVYCGKYINKAEDYAVFARGSWESDGSNDDGPLSPSVFGSVSEYSSLEPFVCFYDKRGVFCNRFRYIGAEKTEEGFSPLPTARNKSDVVRLSFKDEISGVTVYQYYSVFSDSGVIAARSEIVNDSDGEITVTELSSLQLDFVSDSAGVTCFSGTWIKEFQRNFTELKCGRFEIDSKSGISSAKHNPFFMVNVKDRVLGFNLVWSGNHKETVEISPYGRVRIQTGINDYNFRYTLKKGETLHSPEAVFTVADGESEITREMHDFALNHIINPEFAYRERPVLINNWEGTGFDFNGEKIYKMAEIAKSAGIELFVLDDGWFGKRNDDTSSLGDWYDNEKKTGGLKKLADKIHSLGMKFGLWVEPEMISEDSDLYRAHSDWAMKIPNVKPLERRRQLCIDICNPEVKNYLTRTLIDLFKKTGVDYVKWDHNRAMSDIYSQTLTNQGEYFYRYYVNLYSMLRDITGALPEVLFESCASGGSRYDLGMQYFMPQNWASDNTNAYDRLFIQEGTLTAYCQSSMGAHVSDYRRSVPVISLESEFNVASIGAFGYEFDITKATEKQLQTIKNQVAYYKAHRKLLQFGDYFRLGDGIAESETGGWIVISKDKSEAIAVLINRETGSKRHRPLFALKGLDDNSFYKVTMRPQDNVEEIIEFTAYGDALNSYGVDIEDIRWRETDAHDTSAAFCSRMLYIKRQNVN